MWGGWQRPAAGGGPAEAAAEAAAETVARQRSSAAAEDSAILGQALGAPTASVTSDKGDVDLSFVVQPDLIDITTEVSDILLSLPVGEYDIDAISRRGTVTVDGPRAGLPG